MKSDGPEQLGEEGLAPADFVQIEHARTKQLILTLAGWFMVADVLYGAGGIALDPTEFSRPAVAVVMLPGLLGARHLAKTDRIAVAGTMLTVAIWLGAVAAVFMLGIMTVAFAALVAVLCIGGILLGARGAIVFGLLCGATAVAQAVAQGTGLYVPPVTSNLSMSLLAATTTIVITVILLHSSQVGVHRAHQRVSEQADRLFEAYRVQRASRQRVRQQARQLETVAELGMRAVTRPGDTRLLQELLDTVVAALDADGGEIATGTTNPDIEIHARSGVGERDSGEPLAPRFLAAAIEERGLETVEDFSCVSDPSPALEATGVRSGLFAGFSAGEKGTGALAIYWRKPRSFSPDEPNFVRAVAHVISTTLEVRDLLAEREREQGTRAQTERLESLGRLAGGVAHDFNNLLTVILACSENLADSDLDSDAQVDVAAIRRATAKAASLTSQLLAFGRQQPLSTTTVSLNAFSERSIEMLRRIVPQRISLDVDYREREIWVRADPSELDRILLNLVLNAVDSIEGSGSIRVQCKTQELSESEAQRLEIEAGTYGSLLVEDSGSGMNEPTRRRIFEPFFTTKGETKGVGLGLAAVHGAVRTSGGAVDVTSELGRGTSFSVYFPLAVPENAPIAEAKSPPAAEHARSLRTILLVEDTELVRRQVEHGLRRAGFVVVSAACGSEALDRWARDDTRIDALVTDVVMPGMSGPELARRLRDTRPALPVLLVSGYPDEELDHHPDAAQYVLLRKPFTNKELVTTLRGLMPKQTSTTLAT